MIYSLNSSVRFPAHGRSDSWPNIPIGSIMKLSNHALPQSRRLVCTSRKYCAPERLF